MAEDFGDEAGQKLVDWATRIAMYQVRIGGPSAGERAMRDAAEQLTKALEAARDSLRDPASAEVRTDGPALPEWAKLDLAEFQAMKGYLFMSFSILRGSYAVHQAHDSEG